MEPQRKMTFALDFDDTFTACPQTWRRFINDVESHGHRVMIVTARRETEANVAEVRAALAECELVLPMVFTNLGSKLAAALKRGITVDIWIDDDPTSLVHGH